MAASVTERQDTAQRQASVHAVFGYRTVGEAAQQYEAQWDAAHPDQPLHWDALALGLLADMNASLPEPFTIESLISLHITGPDLPHLHPGWTDKARTKFRSLDLHLDTYTLAHVQVWRDQGHGGYPWPPPLDPAETPTEPGKQTSEISGGCPR